jgi:hypothetical protein
MEIYRRTYSKESFLCLWYNLLQSTASSSLPFPVKIKLLTAREMIRMIPIDGQTGPSELKGHIERINMFYSDIPTCYAAYTEDGQPCAMCWLIESKNNDHAQRYFKGNILDLRPDEVLLEYTYTHPRFRGCGLMAYVTHDLFRRAKENGFKKAVAYVRTDNLTSVKASRRIGWKTSHLKKVSFYFFKRAVSYCQVDNLAGCIAQDDSDTLE